MSRRTQAYVFSASLIFFKPEKGLSEIYGFKYNKVFIPNQKTGWDSCSAQNNINLNINLVRVSNDLQDNVILHEFVQTKIKNHSLRFWNELNKYPSDTRH